MGADTSGDGIVTKAEFTAILCNEKVQIWLNMLGLSLNETSELFDIIAGSDGSMSFLEFKQGIAQMQGVARSEDVMAIKRQGRKISDEIAELKAKMCELVSAFPDAFSM